MESVDEAGFGPNNNQPVQAENFLKKQFLELKKSYHSSVVSIFNVSLIDPRPDPHYKAHLELLLREVKEKGESYFRNESYGSKSYDFEPYDMIYANIPSLRLVIFCDLEFPFKPPKVKLWDIARPKNKFTGHHPNIINGKMSFPLIGEKWCPAITLKIIVEEVIKVLCMGSLEHLEPELRKEYYISCIKYALESHELYKKGLRDYVDKDF